MTRHCVSVTFVVLLLVCAAGAALAETINVSAVDFRFEPRHVVASVGDVIHWTNNTTGTMHTVTSGSPSEEGSVFDVVLAPGQTFDWTVTGTERGHLLKYECEFHEEMGMRGAITVRP